MTPAAPRMLAACATAGLLLLAPQAALCGAETKPEGRGITILTTGYYWAEADFGQSFGTGKTPFGGGGKFDKVSESLWFEYGWTDDLNVLFGWELAHLRFRNQSGGEDNTGVGNPKLGLKYRFWNPPDPTATMWAVQAEVEPPLGQGGSPSLGYRDLEVGLVLLASRKSELLAFPFSISSSLGYRLRLGNAADQWKVTYSLSKGSRRWYYWLGASGEFSVGNEDNAPASTNPQQASDFDRAQVSSFVSFQMTQSYWLQFGGAIDVAGRNTGEGKEVKLGIWYTF